MWSEDYLGFMWNPTGGCSVSYDYINTDARKWQDGSIYFTCIELKIEWDEEYEWENGIIYIDGEEAGTALYDMEADKVEYSFTADLDAVTIPWASFVLRENGAEVLYLSDLAAQAIKTDEAVKLKFVDELIHQSGDAARHYHAQLARYFMDMKEEDIIEQAMVGLSALQLNYQETGPLCRLLSPDSQFLIHPMPNLYFTRDPFSSIGSRVSHSHMYYPTRHRETIFSKYIFKYHPDFMDVQR